MKLASEKLWIETARLIFRDFEPTDLLSVHEYASDVEVVRYQNWGPNTEQQTREFLGLTQIWRHEKPRQVYEFAVTLKATQVHIGGCGIRIKSFSNLEGDIGYALNKKYWHQGLGTEAARGILEFGFKTLGLHRVFATCDPDNSASARILEKSGMRKEGLLRKNILQHGKWRDSLLYARLIDD